MAPRFGSGKKGRGGGRRMRGTFPPQSQCLQNVLENSAVSHLNFVADDTLKSNLTVTRPADCYCSLLQFFNKCSNVINTESLAAIQTNPHHRNNRCFVIVRNVGPAADNHCHPPEHNAAAAQ